MLIGEFVSKLTGGNRLAVPSKFRNELGDNLIILNGYEGCLILVNESKFLALTKEIYESSFIDDAVRDLSRFLVGSAHELKLDKQGRFVLPYSLLEYSGLKNEVYFIGLMRWVEIWDKNRWDERKKYIKDNVELITKKLIGLKDANK